VPYHLSILLKIYHHLSYLDLKVTIVETLEGIDDDDDMLVVWCCLPIGVLAVVVALLRFPVLLVSFDGAAIDGEYDCCAYT
jgi:hypothetical protein